MLLSQYIPKGIWMRLVFVGVCMTDIGADVNDIWFVEPIEDVGV